MLDTGQAMFAPDRITQEGYQVTYRMSYMEIYKDEVYDLLVTRENVCALGNPCRAGLNRSLRRRNFQYAKIRMDKYS